MKLSNNSSFGMFIFGIFEFRNIDCSTFRRSKFNPHPFFYKSPVNLNKIDQVVPEKSRLPFSKCSFEINAFKVFTIFGAESIRKHAYEQIYL